MTKVRSITYTFFLICSITLNVLMINLYFGGGWEQRWTKLAAEEAEKVASISCSGHGRAFLDSLGAGIGKPICECNACFKGPDCAEFVPDCVVDADR
jgi:hypothetical protein